MKTTELMIGDFVEVFDDSTNNWKAVQIVSIDETEIGYKECGYTFNTKHFVPIAITTKILESNGFKKGGDIMWESVWMGNSAYIKWWQTCYTLELKDIKVDINCVHELQHAYKIAGIDIQLNI